jgi:hypothetical protein
MGVSEVRVIVIKDLKKAGGIAEILGPGTWKDVQRNRSPYRRVLSRKLILYCENADTDSNSGQRLHQAAHTLVQPSCPTGNRIYEIRGADHA